MQCGNIVFSWIRLSCVGLVRFTFFVFVSKLVICQVPNNFCCLSFDGMLNAPNHTTYLFGLTSPETIATHDHDTGFVHSLVTFRFVLNQIVVIDISTNIHSSKRTSLHRWMNRMDVFTICSRCLFKQFDIGGQLWTAQWFLDSKVSFKLTLHTCIRDFDRWSNWWHWIWMWCIGHKVGSSNLMLY